MLDLKAELMETGIPFEPIGWVKAPAYPYGIFEDEVDIRGADLPSALRVLVHSVTISAYHNDYDQILSVRDKLAAWSEARALSCRLHVQYEDAEDHYTVRLTSTVIEKKGMIYNGSK